MKYIDADLLRKEIERRRLHFNKEAEKYQALNNGYSQNCYGARDALRDLENFLDTLSEEPDKSLEEAAKEYAIRQLDKHLWQDVECFGAGDIDAFIAGADWQARQLLQGSPMPEDTVLFNKGVAEGRRLEREDMLKDAVEGDVYGYVGPLRKCTSILIEGYPEKYGSKVRIIVLKEEE